jgi:predicted O-methyltransferase YrrM
VTTTADVRTFALRLLASGVVTARSDGAEHELRPVSIGVDEGDALRQVIVGDRATRTIDVGLGYAIASLFMCSGLLATAGSEHVAIDPFQATRFSDVGLQSLEDAGVRDLVTFEARPSEIVLPELLGKGASFDVAFLDGNHRFDWVFVDLVFLGRLVKPGGAVFVDDHQLSSVQHAVAFATSNLGWHLEASSDEDPLHHWVVLRTATGPDERDFDHFVVF